MKRVLVTGNGYGVGDPGRKMLAEQHRAAGGQVFLARCEVLGFGVKR